MMTGNDKIIEKILADAAAEGDAILAEANAEAERIAAAADRECASLTAERDADAARAVARMESAAASSAALEQRSALLRARRAEIEKTVEELPRYLNALPDEAYFEALYRCASQFRGSAGEIALNARDLARLPADFTQKLAAAGVTATVAEKPAEIVGGFILKCGDIDLSADFEALINEKRDALEDLINRRLFAE